MSETDASTEPVHEEAGEEAEPNTLKDKFGIERPYDPEKYPEDSAARQGKITKPSGVGGATPKSRPDHQDMFPMNPPPSESAAKKGEENDRIAKGEASPLNAEGEMLPEGEDPDARVEE